MALLRYIFWLGLGKNNLMAIATAAFLPSKVVVSVRGEPTMEYEGKLMQRLAKLLFRFADGVVLQTKLAMEFFPNAVRKKSKILSKNINCSWSNYSLHFGCVLSNYYIRVCCSPTGRDSHLSNWKTKKPLVCIGIKKLYCGRCYMCNLLFAYTTYQKNN